MKETNNLSRCLTLLKGQHDIIFLDRPYIILEIQQLRWNFAEKAIGEGATEDILEFTTGVANNKKKGWVKKGWVKKGCTSLYYRGAHPTSDRGYEIGD